MSALQAVYDADDLDFRLRPGSAAVDRGMVLPSVTDGFTGSAPDLGALEVGGTAPHYGPRPQEVTAIPTPAAARSGRELQP